MIFTVNEIRNLDLDKIKLLIDNQVAESKHIEYKSKLPSESYDDKKEFLADVSSFANSDGGVIFYGVKEENGAPTELTGLLIDDVDKEILRQENLLRTSIEPRLNGIFIQPVKISDVNYIIALYIPRSFNPPHVVNFQKHWRFYSRSSAGKYPLDVFEVKSLATASEAVIEKIRNFRLDRVSRIINEETPVPMEEKPKFILHIIPISSFLQSNILDFGELFHREVAEKSFMNKYQKRYNFEGYLFHDYFNLPATSYIQIYRSGIIEIVNTNFTFEYDKKKQIYVVDYERQYCEYLEFLLKAQSYFGITAPYLICNSMININEHLITPPTWISRFQGKPIVQKNLLIPELYLSDQDGFSRELLKPMFDPVWNACGYQESFNYDENGNWNGK